jgi:hypothetical protein
MRWFAFVGLVGIVGGRLAARLLQRWLSRLADGLRLGTMIFTQVVVTVILGWTALGAAQEGGRLMLALAVGFGVVALCSLALAAFFAWAWVRDDDEG